MKIGSILKKLGLLAVSSLVCFALLEGGFRLAGYKAIHDIYSRPELFWRYDELLGWSHEPGAHGDYVGPRPFPIEFRTQVRINSLGLRGPEIPDLPSGGARVLMLGDSQVAAFEVDEDKTFVRLLEQRLAVSLARPVQVINAGVRGYGTDQEYLYYREQGQKLGAKVVVLFFSNNDLEDNTTLHRARRPFGKPAFALRDSGDLELVGYPAPDYSFCSAYRLDDHFAITRIDSPRARAFCWLQTRLTDHSAILTFVGMRLQQNPALMRTIFDLGTPAGQRPAVSVPGIVSPANALTTALLLKLNSEIVKQGASLMILGTSWDLQGVGDLALREAGIRLLFDDTSASEPWRKLMFKNDSHANVKGHQAIAELLSPTVEDLIRTAYR